jgi:hypothetical protein
MYIRGVSPEDAADQAAAYNARLPADRLRK